jgi:RNA polymerase sigma-70 factor (ECF subfamily)
MGPAKHHSQRDAGDAKALSSVHFHPDARVSHTPLLTTTRASGLYSEAQMQTASVPRMAGGLFPPEFEETFQEHYVLVYRTAYGITGRVEDAEDVVQTIFLRLLQRETPRDCISNPRGYLYRAAVNLSLTVVDTRRRRARTEESADVAASVPARASNRAEELHRQLYEAIAQLKPKAAAILTLRYLHNYSDAEIAKLLGTSRGVIAVTLYRSRARLKKLLNASLGEEI